MEIATRRSRWARPKNKNVVFQATDLAICKLLTPYVHARDPWGYTYLPSNYFAPLLGRGDHNVPDRLPKLRADDYLTIPDQPRFNHHYIIYQLGNTGVAELHEEGFHFRVDPRALAHELGACLVAASFELGSRKHNLPIQILPTPDISKRPDWPVFSMSGREVLLEFDTGSESLEVIERKFECYLEAAEKKLLRRPLFLFITTKKLRVANMIEKLKRTIDHNHYPYKLAEHFAFGAMEYDRFLNKIPKPTDWAVVSQYERAGYAPFSFRREVN
jgi:hypothetical protein